MFNDSKGFHNITASLKNRKEKSGFYCNGTLKISISFFLTNINQGSNDYKS